MLLRRLLPGLLCLATLLAATSSNAEEQERFYFTGYGGYRFGTSFEAQWAGPGGGRSTPVNIPGGGEFGFAIDFRLTRSLMLEASYDRQSTTLRFDDRELSDMGVELWQAGLHYEFVKPEDYELDGYFLFTLGVTRLDPSEMSSETRFSGAIGLGTKAFFTDNIGVRIQGRFSVASFGDGALLCAISNNCYVPPDWIWLYLGDITAGIVVRL